MYPWLVYLHLIAVFGFLIAHGTSAAASFALAKERSLDRICALLDLSRSTYGLSYVSLLVLLLTGIANGFLGNWWGRGWIWLALALLIVLTGLMGALGTGVFVDVRKAVGLPYYERMKEQPALPRASTAEIDALLAKVNPMLLTVTGFGGIAIIAWLMMFKPF